MRTPTLALALAVAAFAALALPAVAGDGCGADPGCLAGTQCGQCGSCAPCRKVCRVACEMKKVEVTCWEVKCEDVCTPLPRLPSLCGLFRDKECGDAGCGQCDPCKEGCREKCVNPPRCGKVRTKKTLVKQTVTKEVPVYKCVVDYVCCDCGGCGAGAEEPAEALPPIAPPPKGAQAGIAPAPAIPDAPLPLPRLGIGG